MAHSTSLLDIYLRQSISFVHADRAWAQRPAPWGKHWLSHRWGPGREGRQASLAMALRSTADARGGVLPRLYQWGGRIFLL